MLQIHLPKRETNKTRLGPMGQFLSRVHDHRRETENAAGGVDEPNSQDMEFVLQQRKGQAIPHKRDKNQILQTQIRMAAHFSTTTYQKTHKETSAQNFPTGIPTSVVEISDCKVNKLQDGPLPPTPRDNTQSFWEFLAT